MQWISKSSAKLDLLFFQATSVIDPCLAQETLDQIDSLLKFYANPTTPNRSKLHEKFNGEMSLATKMGKSLIEKFPRDQGENTKFPCKFRLYQRILIFFR